MFDRKERRLKAPRIDADREGVGKAAYRLLMTVLRLALTGIVAFILGIAACVYIIPVLCTSIAGMTGVGYETDFLSVVILLFLPSLAASAIVVVGYVALVRRISGALKRAFQKSRGGRDSGAAGKG